MKKNAKTPLHTTYIVLVSTFACLYEKKYVNLHECTIYRKYKTNNKDETKSNQNTHSNADDAV